METDKTQSDLTQTIEALNAELVSLRQKTADLEQEISNLDAEKSELEILLEVHTSHSDNMADELLHRVETTLRENAKRFRLIAEATPIPIILSRLSDGEIVYANRLAGILVNLPAEKLVGHNTLEFYYTPNHRQKLVDILMQQGHVKDHEVQIRRTDGTILWISISIQPLTFDDEPCLLSVMYDLTERQQAEAERARLSAMQQELDLAHQIQVSLLPPPRPDWTEIDIVCYSTPARDVGGDFYSYQEIITDTTDTSHRYGLAVGDVSGKGMPAALLMAVSVASFRAIRDQVSTPSELLTNLDQAITGFTTSTGQNCALCYIDVTIDKLADKQKTTTLRVANAGCIFPIIRRTDGSTQWAEVGGLPLGTGLGRTLGYPDLVLSLDEGDIVVLSSDGVVEAMRSDHEIFGLDRFEQTVATGPNNSSEAMLTHILTKVGAFVGEAEAHDDLTIVVLKI